MSPASTAAPAKILFTVVGYGDTVIDVTTVLTLMHGDIGNPLQKQ